MKLTKRERSAYPKAVRYFARRAASGEIRVRILFGRVIIERLVPERPGG